MPYVRIPDPKIIDLSAWHQLINVVNQHSDSIAAITNDFGANYERVYSEDSANYAVQYDVSSQKILYGRARVEVAGPKTGDIWYEQIDFISPFSFPPVVTATILAGNTDADQNDYVNAVVAIYKTTVNSFNYRLVIPNGTGYNQLTSANGALWVNWIAVGPR